MSKKLTEAELKKKRIKFLFKKQYSAQVESRVSALVLDSYLDLFVKSVKNSTWSQDKSCYYVCLSQPTDTFLDLRKQALREITRLFKSNFKNTIVLQENSFVIYK